MYRSTASVPLIGLASAALALTLLAEGASSATDHMHSTYDEKSITAIDEYAWAPKGSDLAYATSDGTIWSVHGPGFAAPDRITRIALPEEQHVEQIVWSPDGQSVAFVSPRLNDDWDTIWLVNLRSLELRDLLPFGAPYGSPGTRALRISSWLSDGRITFVLHCGTGCVGLHAVQTHGNEEYWDFCDASGDIFWSPDLKVAVVENDAEGIGPIGLGLVSASDGVTVANKASEYRARRECKSIIKGADRCGTCGPSQNEPNFNSWFPDSKMVLYTDVGLNSSQLELWNTLSGSRKTLVANGSSGAVSPDGRYVSFIRPEHASDLRFSKRVSLAIMDLRSERIIGSSKVPTVQSPPRWSPSMSYLAVLSKDDQLLIASLGSDGVQVRRTGVTGGELSWSPDGKYLAVRSELSNPSKPRILKIPFEARLSAYSTPEM